MKQETKTVDKSMKPKVSSLRRSNKINKSPVRLIMKMREKTQITNIDKERGNIIINSTNTKRKIKGYYEQHGCKCDTQMKWTDSFKDTNFQSSLKKKLKNGPTPSKEIEFIGKNLMKKTQGPDSFIGGSLPNNKK